MFITSHPLCGSALSAAARRSPALDPVQPVHLRIAGPQDAEFVAALHAQPDVAAERSWLQNAALLTAAGTELTFIAVTQGHDCGLVRLHDFAEIDRESSFAWSVHLMDAHQSPGLATTVARLVYDLGFGTIGFARAHLIVSADDPALAAFHASTGAELEHDDGEHRYFRFGADDHQHLRADAARRSVTVS